MRVRRSRFLPALGVACLFAGLSSFAESADSAAPKKLFGSSVLPWEGFVVKPTAAGERRDVTDLPTATLERFESHITTLRPGQASHPPHQHAQEEFIIIKEGTVDVQINGKITRAGRGSVLFFASNDMHNLTNVGETPATYHVFNLATALTKIAPKEGAAKAALPGTLASQVFRWEDLKVESRSNGFRRGVFDSATVTLAKLECHVTTLNIGETPHPAHRHPDEELIVVQEGTIEATINGVSKRGGPGSIFFYGSNDDHGMRNVGGTPATYHVIRLATELTPAASTAAPAPKKA